MIEVPLIFIAKVVVRVTGIEPTSPAWKAEALAVVLYPLLSAIHIEDTQSKVKIMSEI